MEELLLSMLQEIQKKEKEIMEDMAKGKLKKKELNQLEKMYKKLGGIKNV